MDDAGLQYRDFRATLTPRWGLVWLHILIGYVTVAALLAIVVLWASPSIAGVALAVIGGLGIGYTLEYLSNFFHEAAHYNVAPGRDRNDRLTNLLFAWLFGKNVETYRRIHFQHHRALGTTMDSENSYFDALRVQYLAAGIFGLKAVRTLRRYREVERQLSQGGEVSEQSRARRLSWMALAGAVDLGLAAILWLGLDSPLAAAAWAWGVLFVFPFFGSLRQLLEHRSEAAEQDADYRKVDHGPVNRLFGDGPLASTLGSAGFNRHALHHWEPQLSYTRLADLERYLARTQLAPAIAERQTSYVATFRRLFRL